MSDRVYVQKGEDKKTLISMFTVDARQFLFSKSGKEYKVVGFDETHDPVTLDNKKRILKSLNQVEKEDKDEDENEEEEIETTNEDDD